ncbi:hypothetical protein SK803_37970 [Lentzea sp. BCCO 10_0856]|uniref:Uncharacterized protein n=1 Tax=Lentzea miocenica TaxID=3095431 RepID=A0ABU4TCW3_9PSEU|nr:hypothetical protein [Lentzea sp. BCCO 10_0856]MDX8036016.1 hypothetical protein [Lentzea sp. BCCO 10_0856]
MATLIIEIHVPFPSEPVVAEGEYPFPWIDVIEDFLGGLEEEGEIEVFDDGEEYGDAYVFFITGADERDLLAVASRTAKLDGVPPGVFAVVSDDEAGEWGLGRRVELPLS